MHDKQVNIKDMVYLKARLKPFELISLREPAMGKGFKVENCARKRPTLPTVDGRWTAEQIPRAGLWL